jgi:integrase
MLERTGVPKYRRVIRDFVQAAKSRPCADCGVSFPYYVMDFDHRPGTTKSQHVSQLRSLGRIKEEVAKCDVVCANCHRQRTHRRRIENPPKPWRAPFPLKGITMRLTDIALRQLPIPQKGQKTYYDDILPNFGCRVSQGGTKSFVVQHGADRQLITIGKFPVISLAEARAEAKRLLAERTLGKHRRKTLSWDAALELYLAEVDKTKRARTAHDYRRLLTRHFAFRSKKLADLTYEDVARKLQKLDGVPSEQAHATTVVKIFLRWCHKPPRRYLEVNPTDGLTVSKRPSRKRVLNDTELVAVYRTALEGTDYFSYIVTLCILLGQRKGELGKLARPWVSDNERTIALPPWVTKNGREHCFPFGNATAAVLRRIPNYGEWFFPAARDHVRGKPTTTYQGWSKDKKAFDKRSGVSAWTLHDLRRTFATNLARLKVLPHVVDKILNHAFGTLPNQTNAIVSAVAQVYNRNIYMPEMREAMELWELHLATLLTLQDAQAA